jgi:hypothetical protein
LLPLLREAEEDYCHCRSTCYFFDKAEKSIFLLHDDVAQLKEEIKSPNSTNAFNNLLTGGSYFGGCSSDVEGCVS